MTSLVRQNVVQGAINFFGLHNCNIDLDTKAGTVIITDDGVQIYRAIRKSKNQWIATFKDNYRFKWGEDADTESRNLPSLSEREPAQTQLATERGQGKDH